MMTFSKGDRVIYTPSTCGGVQRWRDSVGTIDKILSLGRIEITWDEDSPFDKFTSYGRRSGVHYQDNLKLLELQYDPTQQGDTDEDI